MGVKYIIPRKFSYGTSSRDGFFLHETGKIDQRIAIGVINEQQAAELVKRWNAYPEHFSALCMAADEGLKHRYDCMISEQGVGCTCGHKERNEKLHSLIGYGQPHPDAPKPFTVVQHSDEQGKTRHDVVQAGSAGEAKIKVYPLLGYKIIAIYAGHLTNLVQ